MSEVARATELLTDLCRGNESAAADLLPLVYDQLRRVASSLLASERQGHTLQPTALVHEAWLRLIDQDCVRGHDEVARRRFIGLGARAMRQILVDHARRHGSDKRGGEFQRVTLPDDLPVASADPAMLLDLEAALAGLHAQSPRLADLAELRLFAGLSVRESASTLEISLATAKTDWALARAWLTRHVRTVGETRLPDPAAGDS